MVEFGQIYWCMTKCLDSQLLQIVEKISYHGKHDFFDGLAEVVVPVGDGVLSGGEVRADEANGRAQVPEADGDGALVAGGAAHPGLDAVDRDIRDLDEKNEAK